MPSSTNSKKIFPACAILFFTAIFIYSGVQVLLFNNVDVYQENALLENLQALILSISFFVFLMVLKEKRNDRTLVLFFAILCLSFVLRELDVERFDLPEIIIFLGAGKGRNFMLLAGFSTTLFFFIKHRVAYNKVLRAFISSPMFRLLMAAMVALIASDIFERSSLDHHVYYEEISELFGYTLLLVASIHFFPQADLQKTKPLLPWRFLLEKK